MRIIHVVLILLILIVAMLAWIGFSPAYPLATGAPHPDIAGLSIGGDGLLKSQSISMVAYFLQAAVMVLALLLIAMGVRKSNRTLLFWAPFASVGLLYQLVWWKIWHGHQLYLRTGETEYFMGFATSTAWMVYGVWCVGLGLLMIYVIGFRHFIFSQADEAEYRNILIENGQITANDSGEL